MKVLKFNNTIAEKIAGRVDKFNAIDPIFIQDDFWILPEDMLINFQGKFPALVNKIINQITLGNITVIDMEDTGNTDVITISLTKNETDEQNEARIVRRKVFWDYTTKSIEI